MNTHNNNIQRQEGGRASALFIIENELVGSEISTIEGGGGKIGGSKEEGSKEGGGGKEGGSKEGGRKLTHHQT